MSYKIIMKWKDATHRHPQGYTKRCLRKMIADYEWENVNNVRVEKSPDGNFNSYYIHISTFVQECLSKYRKLTELGIKTALMYHKSIIDEFPDSYIIRTKSPRMGNTIVIVRRRFNQEWIEAALAEADKKRAEILMKKEREEEELEKTTLEEKFSEKFEEMFKNIP